MLLCGMTLAENGNNLALYGPLLVPFAFWNEDGVQLGVRGLQAYAVVFFFLEETLEGGTTTHALLQMGGNHNIAVVTGGLWFDDHVITVTNVVLNHGTPFDNQSIGIVMFHFASHIDHLLWIRGYFERLTSSN